MNKKNVPSYIAVTKTWGILYEEIMSHSFGLCVHDALACVNWYRVMLKKLREAEHEEG